MENSGRMRPKKASLRIPAIRRILDKVFLEHLATHIVKRIVSVFVNMQNIANVNISCNNELLIDIFTVLSNFIVAEYISVGMGWVERGSFLPSLYPSWLITQKEEYMGTKHNFSTWKGPL